MSRAMSAAMAETLLAFACDIRAHSDFCRSESAAAPNDNDATATRILAPINHSGRTRKHTKTWRKQRPKRGMDARTDCLDGHLHSLWLLQSRALNRSIA